MPTDARYKRRYPLSVVAVGRLGAGVAVDEAVAGRVLGSAERGRRARVDAARARVDQLRPGEARLPARGRRPNWFRDQDFGISVLVSSRGLISVSVSRPDVSARTLDQNVGLDVHLEAKISVPSSL